MISFIKAVRKSKGASMLLRYRELKGYKYIVEESKAYYFAKLAFIEFESKYLSPNKVWAKIRYGIWYRMVRKFAKRSSTSAQKPRGKVVEI